jgi:zinc transporter ZupT
MIVILALVSFVAILIGGLFAIRFHDRLHLILGFAAGALLGVAFFHIIPEAVEMTEDIFSIDTIMIFVAVGFALYMVLDRIFVLHSCDHSHEDSETKDDAGVSHRGLFGMGSLLTHMVLDGMAIGVSFAISKTLGLAIAIPILVHNISDGINMVGMIMRHGGSRKDALKWILITGIAPFTGIIAGSFISIPQTFVSAFLALLAGIFIYLGAGDLLPESHHRHPTHWTTISTVVGMAVMFLIVSLVHSH